MPQDVHALLRQLRSRNEDLRCAILRLYEGDTLIYVARTHKRLHSVSHAQLFKKFKDLEWTVDNHLRHSKLVSRVARGHARQRRRARMIPRRGAGRRSVKKSALLTRRLTVQESTRIH